MTAGSGAVAGWCTLLAAALALATSAPPARAQQAEEEPVRPTAGPALDLRPGQARESFLTSQLSFSRVSLARAQKEQTLRDRFTTLGLPFPPAGLYLRVFKVERIVEVWVLPRGGERYAHLVTYPVCAVSGWLGPKRGQGDLQIPEGFYEVESFNPMSEYHLSLRLNYPNEADRRAHPGAGSLGGDIYVHGGCQTIGCVPITDEHIRELYWLAVQARAGGARHIPVHVFPTRLDDAGLDWLEGFFGGDPALMDFWNRMQEGYAFFERERRVPGVGVDGSGRYVVGEPSRLSGGLALLGTAAAESGSAAQSATRPEPEPEAPGLLGEPAAVSALDAEQADSGSTQVRAPGPDTAGGAVRNAAAGDTGVPPNALADSVQAAALPASRGLPERAEPERASARRGAGGLLGVPADTTPDAGATVAADSAGGDDTASDSAAVEEPAGDPVAVEAAAPEPAPTDPIPGLLGMPITAPESAEVRDTAGPGLATGGAVEAGGDRAEDGEDRRSAGRLLGRPQLLGTAAAGGPSLHASFLIPMQQRDGDGGTHGIPWRIHVRRPAW